MWNRACNLDRRVETAKMIQDVESFQAVGPEGIPCKLLDIN